MPDLELKLEVIRRWWVIPAIMMASFILLVVYPFTTVRFMDHAGAWLAEVIARHGFKLETV